MTDPTPEERRDAWLKLVSQMEAKLLATREHAKAMVGLCRPGRAPDWEATAWAAQRLLEELKGLEPPVVPVDHERGQGDLLTLVSSTPGENPGDDVERYTCHATGPVPVTRDCGWEGCPLRGSEGSAACFLRGAGS